MELFAMLSRLYGGFLGVKDGFEADPATMKFVLGVIVVGLLVLAVGSLIAHVVKSRAGR